MSQATVDKKPKISQILQSIMQEKGIHVAELARRINLKQPTIQRIASGLYQRPHLKTLKPIADFFDITVEQLTGMDPIHWLPSKQESIKRVPLLTPSEAFKWPNITETQNYRRVVIDVPASPKTFAISMPDASMEPLFPKDTLLIIDPDKPATDRDYVVIKLQDLDYVIFRQLLIDGKESYTKPLSPNFNQFKMALLNPNDLVAGVLIQARLDF